MERWRLRHATNPGRRTFAGHTALARVVGVHDGDTISVLTRLDASERFWEYSLRIAGINTPELRPPLSIPDRALHISAATAARNCLCQLLPKDSIVRIRFHEEDKFGRLLGDISTAPQQRYWTTPLSVDVAEWMLERGLAHKYTGGKKQEFSAEELQRIVEQDVDE